VRWVSWRAMSAPPYPDLARHLVDEPEVMRHQHQTAVVLVERSGEGVNGLDVQVVGGLVQQLRTDG